MFKLGKRSKQRLLGVHPGMVRVVGRAIQLTGIDFTVGEGLRTMKRQRKLVARGKSRTLRSRHLTGHAVDLWALHPDTGKVTWDWEFYWPIVKAMTAASHQLGIPIESGANWKSFRDGPHHQHPWSLYK